MQRPCSRRHLGATTTALAFRGFGLTIASLALQVGLAGAQECPPQGAVCPHAGIPIAIGFETFPAGTTVEGLGAVHPDLAISSLVGVAPACVPGTAAVIETGNPFPFSSYGTASTNNGCLTGTKGFGDTAGCTLDYDFTFSVGTTISCFSIHMLDFGDLLPYGGATHVVTLQAFAGVTLVDQAQLTMLGGVDLVGGDACTASGSDPGNTRLRVTGAGITRVTLSFDASPDPNVGFDDIEFCKDTSPVPVAPATWGQLKTLYTTP